MKIGVPKEIKNNENRVGLVPGGVRQLFMMDTNFLSKITLEWESEFPMKTLKWPAPKF